MRRLVWLLTIAAVLSSGIANAAVREQAEPFPFDESRPRNVIGDAPAGWGTSCWQGPATGKVNYHVESTDITNGASVNLEDLFGEVHGLTVSDIESISFHTKKGTAVPAGNDWWVTIYTQFEGDGQDSGSWFDSRLHAIPDVGPSYSQSFVYDTWNMWSTDSAASTTNQLVFYDNPRGFGGYYTSLANLAAGPVDWDGDSNNDHDYSSELIKAITLQTDSGWNGFDGLIDGLTITLTNGQVGEVDLVAGPTEVWVDDDYCDTCANDGHLWGYNAFDTIQDGVDAVTGSTVNVAAGTYDENVVISTDNLMLLGPNAGIDPNTDTRVAEAVIRPINDDNLTVESGYVVIDGFTFDGDNPAINSNNVFNGADIDANTAIYAQNPDSRGPLTVRNNIVKNYGLLAFCGDTGSTVSSGNAIHNNRWENIFYIWPTSGNLDGRAIAPLWNYYANVYDNVVVSAGVGIYAENAHGASAVTPVVWENNDITATSSGIWYNLAYSNATALTIQNNTVTVMDDPGRTRWNGVWLTSLGNSSTDLQPVISGNIINGSTAVTQQCVGYHLWNDPSASGITVSGGSVNDCDYGVWVNNYDGYGPSNGGTTTVIVDGVTINNAALAGVYVKDNPDNTNDAAVYAEIGAGTVIDSDEYDIIVLGPDAEVTSIDSSLAAMSILVDNSSIQAAIDVAPPGSEINVAAGTYNEKLTIDKPLSLLGEPGAIVDGTGLGLVTAVNVKSGDVTVDNLSFLNFGGNGIIVGYESTPPGDLQNVHITNNVVGNIQPGSSHGFGIYVGYEAEGFGVGVGTLTDHLDYTGLVISGNEVYNTANAALVLQSITSSGAPLEVSNNHIHDAGTSGVWIDTARNIELTGNELDSNSNGVFLSAIPDGWYVIDGTYGPKDITITDNVITNNTSIGIVIYAGWPSTFAFNYNDIVGNNNYGMQSFLSGTVVDATNNWWGDATGPLDTSDDTGSGGLHNPYGLGDEVSDGVNYDPWLGSTSGSNTLQLGTGTGTTPLYLQPGEQFTLPMDVLNLAQRVYGCQAFVYFNSTYFQTSDGYEPIIAVGGGVWDQILWDVWTVDGDLDVAVGVNLSSTIGTIADGTVANFTLTAGTTEGTTTLEFQTKAEDPDQLDETMLGDTNGQPVSPLNLVDSQDIIIDGTKPVLSNLAAEQGGDDVLACAQTVIQGQVVISVDAADVLSGGTMSDLAGEPTVTVENGGDSLAVTYVNESPAGTFNYHVTVDASTANGTWTITATVEDNSGNVSDPISGTFCVNKDQATGQVQSEDITDGVTRTVTFKATDAGGAVLATWDIDVTFTGTIGTYTLVDVPAGTTGLSAKTAWTLREKLAVTPDVDGQIVADFVGDGVSGWIDADDHYLRGGDLNGSNSINILDFSLLAGGWGDPDTTTAGARADIDGNGWVWWQDFQMMANNWYNVGDDE